MKKIFALARLTFLNPFLTKSAYVLFAILSVITFTIFFIAKGDGSYSSELAIRIQYSAIASVSILTVASLWTACFSMRGDIDSKRMHMLTAYPMSRAQIYLGKWLGLSVFSIAGLLVISVSIYISTKILLKDIDKTELKSQKSLFSSIDDDKDGKLSIKEVDVFIYRIAESLDRQSFYADEKSKEDFLSFTMLNHLVEKKEFNYERSLKKFNELGGKELTYEHFKSFASIRKMLRKRLLQNIKFNKAKRFLVGTDFGSPDLIGSSNISKLTEKDIDPFLKSLSKNEEKRRQQILEKPYENSDMNKWELLSCTRLFSVRLFYALDADKNGSITETEFKLNPLEGLNHVSREIIPMQFDPEEIANKRLDIALENGLTIDDKNDWVKKETKRVRDRQQIVRKGQNKQWSFETKNFPSDFKTFTLSYIFHCKDFYKSQKGHFQVFYTDVDKQFLKTKEGLDQKIYISNAANTRYTIDFNLTMPENAYYLVIQFVSDKANSPILFMNKTGMKLKFKNSSWVQNIGKCFILFAIHLAIISAIGLTISSLFTLSVAAFCSIVLYFLSFTSGLFFSNDTDNALAIMVNKVGLFFITGMEVPDAIKPMSKAVEISGENTGMSVTRSFGELILKPVEMVSKSFFEELIRIDINLYLGLLLYLLGVMIFGIFMFRKKELDRVH